MLEASSSALSLQCRVLIWILPSTTKIIIITSHANEVQLALSLLAYNLCNLWRRLALPRLIENWSRTSLQQRLVKTGGTCSLLLAAVGRESSDETVIWQYAPADRRAVTSGGVAEAAGVGNSIQAKSGRRGV